jgi:hypothetical protein
MPSKRQTHISHQIPSISDLFSMFNEELDKFHQAEDLSNRDQNLKLIVDFESGAKVPEKKQMEIGDIKYKKRRKVVVKEVDLKRKEKTNNSIF